MNFPLIPAKAGTQCFGPKAAKVRTPLVQRTAKRQNWVPAFAGMSGV